MVAFVTSGRDQQPWGRLSHWLGRGFDDLGVRFDSVYLDGPTGVVVDGGHRELRLGRLRGRTVAPAAFRYLRDSSPELTLVTPPHLSPFVVAAGKLAGRHVVPWEVSFPHVDMPARPRYLRPLLPHLQRLAYRWAPAIAVVSEDVGTNAAASFRNRIVEIPNPIDVDDVRARAGVESKPEDRIRLCAIGRLTESKGYDVLLRALALARPDMHRDWELLVLGEGELRADLNRLAAALGLRAHVRFLGNVDNPYATLASAHALVHAARWEGFGVVLTEAMALDVPVVATSCPGGPREILEGGEAGLLVAPEDPAQLAAAIVRIVRDDALRASLSARGRERVAAYAPAAVARRLIDLAAELRST